MRRAYGDGEYFAMQSTLPSEQALCSLNHLFRRSAGRESDWVERRIRRGLGSVTQFTSGHSIRGHSILGH